MTDMRDRIATIVAGLRAVDYGEIFPSDYETADALIAALPGMVLPLEWLDYPMGSRCKTNNDYSINYWEHEKVFVDAYTTMRRHPTLEAAKATANAHHRAQVMAAFGFPFPKPKEDQ